MRDKILKLVSRRYWWWGCKRKKLFAAAVTSVARKELQGLNVFVAVWQEANRLSKTMLEDIVMIENKIVVNLKPARSFFYRHYHRIKEYDRD